MNMQFNQETFRDDFSFSNSAFGIKRFPFPFDQDTYNYSMNVEPHTSGAKGSAFEYAIDIDEHYIAEMKDRELVLAKDPDRLISLPHMIDAEWDMVEFVMESLSTDYPELFELSKDGDNWHWINKPLNIDDTFVFGDVSSLPMPPFEYISRQVQGDWVVMDQRDNDLFADLGVVTTQADWSMAFDAPFWVVFWRSI